MRIMFALLFLPVLAALYGQGHLHAQTPLQIGLEERTDLHVVLEWPFTITAGKAGSACAALEPAHVEITEDGSPVAVTRLTRASSRTTHLLLIDTSRSMSGERGVLHRRLGQTKLAARHYVDLVSGGLAGSADDRVGIISFDDDLVMHSPPVRVADAARLADLRDSIAGIDGGYNTAFLDAVHRVADTVDGLAERFVLVLISDGEDTASVFSEVQVRQLISRANNVTAFGLGIGLKSGRHRTLLKFLAEVTGGEYYDLGDSKDPETLGSGLRKRFSDIHRRLEHQYYATYVTERLQPSNSDDGYFVDVRIRAPDQACRVTNYKRQRYVQARTRNKLRAGEHWRRLDTLPATGRAIVQLGLRELARDAGPLAVWGNEPQGEPARVPLTQDRTVELLVPPLDKALEAGTLEVVELVDEWLDTQLTTKAGRVAPASHLGPRAVNGKTFLHNRDLLASAIFDSSPPHREWVKAQLEPELRSRYRNSVPAGYSDEQVDRVVRARLEQPRVEDLENRLAAWLGDVTTLELAFALERKWTNEWAAGPSAGGPGLERVRSRWRVLVEWLRPPDRVRVFAPLLLSYDVDRESFGFHRVVLPRLRHLPRSQVPDLPLGLEVVAQLVSGNETPEPRECRRIRAVEHHSLQPKELPPTAFPRRAMNGRDMRRLRLRLGGEPCGDIELNLIADIVEGKVEPFCTLSVDREDRQSIDLLFVGRTIPECRDLAR